jgi:formylglycine-generating enzyme required for sulfatase activity
MAGALRKAGYQVTLTRDRDLKTLKDELRAFRRQVAGGDEVVLFYSGHGVQLGGDNYLLPVDVRAESEDQVRDDAIALSAVLADLRTARPAFTLAIVDACRDNPFPKSGRAIGGRGLTGVAGATGQMVLYSAGEGQQALDRLSDADTSRNGVFTRVFIKEMERPGVPVDQVLKNVRIEVNRLAMSVHHEQVPALYDQVLGSYFFYPPVASDRVAPTPVALPQAAPPPPVAVPVAAPLTPAVNARILEGEARSGAGIKDCEQCPEMIVVSGGSFTMGSPESEIGRHIDEAPVHRVSVGSFLLSKTEVTQAQWQAVMGGNPSHFKACGENCPVENISWNDAQEFARKLSALTGKNYWLPSEAEWEYAARAGSKTAFPWGPTASHDHANYGQEECCGGLSQGRDRWSFAAPVAQFAPNAFGLHDMQGNVWEWVQDIYHPNYNGAPAEGVSWSAGGDPARRVIRGGSWFNAPQFLRSATRAAVGIDDRNAVIGLRIARTL